MNSFNHNTTLYYDSDSHSGSDPDKKPVFDKPKKIQEKPVFRKESLFSTQLNSDCLPWEDKVEKETEKRAEKDSTGEKYVLF